MKTRFYAEAHIPRGSGDAEYRIMAGVGLSLNSLRNEICVAIIDPAAVLDDPCAVAEAIADALNNHADSIL